MMDSGLEPEHLPYSDKLLPSRSRTCRTRIFIQERLPISPDHRIYSSHRTYTHGFDTNSYVIIIKNASIQNNYKGWTLERLFTRDPIVYSATTI